MRRIVIAPEKIELDGPVVFLAGPTRCPWHEVAMKHLRELDPTLHVASPKRPVDSEKDFDDAAYAEQVDWETHFLRRAGEKGVVLFWLARELDHRCDRPHAQTTRFELGEWKERCRRDRTRLALGIEEGFTGGRYVRRRFGQDCPEVRIATTLRDTCAEAARLARC
ncbi:MAG: hypothetical protein ACAI25_20755 [Planctomycetota bacterium]